MVHLKQTHIHIPRILSFKENGSKQLQQIKASKTKSGVGHISNLAITARSAWAVELDHDYSDGCLEQHSRGIVPSSAAPACAAAYAKRAALRAPWVCRLRCVRWLRGVVDDGSQLVSMLSHRRVLQMAPGGCRRWLKRLKSEVLENELKIMNKYKGRW